MTTTGGTTTDSKTRSWTVTDTFAPSPSMPGYEVSVDGIVRHIETGEIVPHKLNGSLLPSVRPSGSSIGGYGKSVMSLIVEAHVLHRPVKRGDFMRWDRKTPLHLDNIATSTSAAGAVVPIGWKKGKGHKERVVETEDTTDITRPFLKKEHLWEINWKREKLGLAPIGGGS